MSRLQYHLAQGQQPCSRQGSCNQAQASDSSTPAICRSRQGKAGTLDGWLTGGGGGKGGASAGPRDMPPLLLPRVPLPPLLLPSEDGQTTRPAKKRKGLTAADRDADAVMLRMLKQVLELKSPPV